jgi:hypothetical protein
MLNRSSPLICVSLALLALVSLPSAARAQGAASDLTNATCAAFVSLPAKDKEQLTIWLAGYFAGQASRPRISSALIATLPEAMGALCAKTPEAMLIGAEMRAVFLPPQAP